jgi:hypothetical protein
VRGEIEMDEEHKPSLKDAQKAGIIDAESKGHVFNNYAGTGDDDPLAHWRIEGGSVYVTHCLRCQAELVVERGGGAWVYGGSTVTQNCPA